MATNRFIFFVEGRMQLFVTRQNCTQVYYIFLIHWPNFKNFGAILKKARHYMSQLLKYHLIHQGREQSFTFITSDLVTHYKVVFRI